MHKRQEGFGIPIKKEIQPSTITMQCSQGKRASVSFSALPIVSVYSNFPRMSSFLKSCISSSPILTACPPYSGSKTLSPTATLIATVSPSLFFMPIKDQHAELIVRCREASSPGPTATTSASTYWKKTDG